MESGEWRAFEIGVLVEGEMNQNIGQISIMEFSLYLWLESALSHFFPFIFDPLGLNLLQFNGFLYFTVIVYAKFGAPYISSNFFTLLIHLNLNTKQVTVFLLLS